MRNVVVLFFLLVAVTSVSATVDPALINGTYATGPKFLPTEADVTLTVTNASTSDNTFTPSLNVDGVYQTGCTGSFSFNTDVQLADGLVVTCSADTFVFSRVALMYFVLRDSTSGLLGIASQAAEAYTHTCNTYSYPGQTGLIFTRLCDPLGTNASSVTTCDSTTCNTNLTNALQTVSANGGVNIDACGCVSFTAQYARTQLAPKYPTLLFNSDGTSSNPRPLLSFVGPIVFSQCTSANQCTVEFTNISVEFPSQVVSMSSGDVVTANGDLVISFRGMPNFPITVTTGSATAGNGAVENTSAYRLFVSIVGAATFNVYSQFYNVFYGYVSGQVASWTWNNPNTSVLEQGSPDIQSNGGYTYLQTVWKAVDVHTYPYYSVVRLDGVTSFPSTITKLVDNTVGTALDLTVSNLNINLPGPGVVDVLVKDYLSAWFSDNVVSSSGATDQDTVMRIVSSTASSALPYIQSLTFTRNRFLLGLHAPITLTVTPATSLGPVTLTGNTVQSQTSSTYNATDAGLLTVTGTLMGRYIPIDFRRSKSVPDADCNHYLADFFFPTATSLRTANHSDSYAAMGMVMPGFVNSTQTLGATTWRPQVKYTPSTTVGAYSFFDLFDNPYGYPSVHDYRYRIIYAANTTLTSESDLVQWASAADMDTWSAPLTLATLRADSRFSSLYPVTVGTMLWGATRSATLTMVGGNDGLNQYTLNAGSVTAFSSLSATDTTYDSSSTWSSDGSGHNYLSLLKVTGPVFSTATVTNVVVQRSSSTEFLAGVLSLSNAPPSLVAVVDGLFNATYSGTAAAFTSVAECVSCGVTYGNSTKLALRNLNLVEATRSGVVASGFALVDVTGAGVYASSSSWPTISGGGVYLGTPTATSTIASRVSGITTGGDMCGERSVTELLQAVDNTDFGVSPLTLTAPSGTGTNATTGGPYTIKSAGLALKLNNYVVTPTLTIQATGVTLWNSTFSFVSVDRSVPSVSLYSVTINSLQQMPTLAISGASYNILSTRGFSINFDINNVFSGDANGLDVDLSTPGASRQSYVLYDVVNAGVMTVGTNNTVIMRSTLNNVTSAVQNIVLSGTGQLQIETNVTAATTSRDLFALQVSGTASVTITANERVTVPCHGVQYTELPAQGVQLQVPRMRVLDKSCVQVSMGAGTGNSSAFVWRDTFIDVNNTVIDVPRVADVVR